MPTLEKQVHACIDSFVEELTTLVQQAAIESVQDALGASKRSAATRARPSARPRRGVKRGGKGGRRTANDVQATADAIVEFVRENPGQGAIEIGDSMGLTPKDVRLPIKKLIDDGKLRTTGRRRGTKYHVGKGSPAKKGPRPTGKKKARKKKARTG